MAGACIASVLLYEAFPYVPLGSGTAPAAFDPRQIQFHAPSAQVPASGLGGSGVGLSAPAAVGRGEDVLDTSGLSADFPAATPMPVRGTYRAPVKSDVVWSNATGSVTGGGLVAEYCCAGAYATIFASRSVRSGSHYWELTFLASNGAEHPLSWTSAGVTTAKPDSNAAHQIEPFSPATQDRALLFVSAFRFGTRSQIRNGDMLMFALDADRRLVYFGVNGAWSNGIPGAQGGAPLGTPADAFFPYVTISSPSNKAEPLGDHWVANFGAAPFRFPIPAGYAAYGTRTPATALPSDTTASPDFVSGERNSFVGRIFKERLTLGRREILLPDGDWIGLSRYIGADEADAAAVLGRIEAGRLVGLVATRVSSSQASSPGGSQAVCGNTVALHFASLPTSVDHPTGCWWIRPATSFLRVQPIFAAARIKAEQGGVKIPATFINVGFAQSDSQATLSVYYYFDPTQSVTARDTFSNGSRPSRGTSTPAQAVEELKLWGKNWSQLLARSQVPATAGAVYVPTR